MSALKGLRVVELGQLLAGQVPLHLCHLRHAAPPQPQLRVQHQQQGDQQTGDEAVGHSVRHSGHLRL